MYEIREEDELSRSNGRCDGCQSEGGNHASQRAFVDELPRSSAGEDRKEVVVDVVGPPERKERK